MLVAGVACCSNTHTAPARSAAELEVLATVAKSLAPMQEDLVAWTALSGYLAVVALIAVVSEQVVVSGAAFGKEHARFVAVCPPGPWLLVQKQFVDTTTT